jgi:hypothetical protein
MTYIPIFETPSFDRSIGSMTNPSSMSANQKIPISISGFNHSGITNSSGTLTINANKSVILVASTYMEIQYPGGDAVAVCQWYDVTNSSWIGIPHRKAMSVSSAVNTYAYSNEFSRAILITSSQIEVEYRIKSILEGTSGDLNGFVQSQESNYGEPWFSIISF